MQTFLIGVDDAQTSLVHTGAYGASVRISVVRAKEIRFTREKSKFQGKKIFHYIICFIHFSSAKKYTISSIHNNYFFVIFGFYLLVFTSF